MDKCNIMIKRLVFFLFLLTVFTSCYTSSIMVDIQRPADINISQEVKNVVLVNRSMPSKDNLAGNIVEGLLSGEGIGADKVGSEYCIEGLTNMLNNSERFNLKNIGIELKGTGTSSFPLPLDWNEVQSICNSYDADALLVLETFDSDSRTIAGTPIVRTRKKKGVKIKEKSYPATLIMEIESGWRIYDVNNKNIIDENKFIEIKEFHSTGKSPEQAIMRLPSKRLALKESGLFAGKQYGFRISPIWIKSNRSYYSGKHEDFKNAKQFVKQGDWNSAILLWKPLTASEDLKISSRASYNMALASEINGSLDTAIEWAIKAKKAGNKKASSYINILSKLKIDQEKLKKQLNN